MSGNARANPLTSLPLGVDISETFDGIFYGLVITTVLLGISVVQVWIYFNTNHDKWPLRYLVGLLFLSDLATVFLNAAAVHHYLVSNFGNLLNLTKVTELLLAEEYLSIIIVFCVQAFYASRVYLIGKHWIYKHWIYSTLIVLSAMGTCVTRIISVVELHEDRLLFITFGKRLEKTVFGLSVALAAFTDITVNITLSVFFARAKTGIKRTDTILQKLVQYTVTRGLGLTVFQAVLLILYFISPEKPLWLSFTPSLSNVYLITMVVMLNSRDALRYTADNFSIIIDAEMSDTTTIAGLEDGGGGGSVNSISRTCAWMKSIIASSFSANSGDEGRSWFRMKHGNMTDARALPISQGA